MIINIAVAIVLAFIAIYFLIALVLLVFRAEPGDKNAPPIGTEEDVPPE